MSDIFRRFWTDGSKWKVWAPFKCSQICKKGWMLKIWNQGRILAKFKRSSFIGRLQSQTSWQSCHFRNNISSGTSVSLPFQDVIPYIWETMRAEHVKLVADFKRFLFTLVWTGNWKWAGGKSSVTDFIFLISALADINTNGIYWFALVRLTRLHNEEWMYI